MKKIKYSICAWIGVVILLISHSGNKLHAQEMPAYRIFDKNGNKADFVTMIKRLAQADVVLFGELHNCPLSHWLELKSLEMLHRHNGSAQSVGLEMLEADVQLILDEYMQKIISPKSYAQEARLWGNYESDYDPVVYYAKSHGLQVTATNVPRRYADLVNRKGFAALDSLSVKAKSYLPPLPIAYKRDEATERMFDGMRSMVHGKSDEKRYFAEAQAIKDATMAWHISLMAKQGYKVLHLNGSFHSDRYEGIVTYLRQYAPSVRIMTISTVRQDAIDSLEDDYRGIADYIIGVPADMTHTN